LKKIRATALRSNEDPAALVCIVGVLHRPPAIARTYQIWADELIANAAGFTEKDMLENGRPRRRMKKPLSI